MSNNSSKLPDILDAFHQEHWFLTKILVLLSIIALTSVGSFSLAQHLLPQDALIAATPITTYKDGVCDADPNQMQSKYTPLPSNISGSKAFFREPITSSLISTPNSNRTQGAAFGGSALSANEEMAFVTSTHPQAPAKPTPPPTKSAVSPPMTTPTIPSKWYTYGFTDDDAKYAEACAAQFVLDYHTFDYNNLPSLETLTYMLSAHAKKLFYQGGADDTHNIHLHMLTQWQNTIEKRKQNQQATVQQPTLSQITPQYSNYIVEVDVGYKLVKEINFGIQPPEIHHDTIILQNTSPCPKLLPNEQNGWEVVDWIDADS